MCRSGFVVATLTLAALVLQITRISAYGRQPENPILGLVIEPAAYSNNECVSVWERHLKRQEDGGSGVGSAHASTKVENANGCIWSIYVKWAESSGIRVVPVPWNSDNATLDWYLDRVNGILLPGGIIEGDKPIYDRYFQTVQHIFDRTIEYNLVKKDKFVLWGTCQGFEMINAAAARNLSVILPGFDGMDPLMMSSNFTHFANASKLWGKAPHYIREAIANRKTQLNWHNKGITLDEYGDTATYPLLSHYLSPLSTTDDVNGRMFISSIEARHDDAAIFATQFHPERPPYEFDNDMIFHDPVALEVSNYLALFLREQLMKNNHSFATPEEANNHTIENYPVVNQGYGIQVYYF